MQSGSHQPRTKSRICVPIITTIKSVGENREILIGSRHVEAHITISSRAECDPWNRATKCDDDEVKIETPNWWVRYDDVVEQVKFKSKEMNLYILSHHELQQPCAPLLYYRSWLRLQH